MIRDAAERSEQVEALTERYRRGEISETVYQVSLSFHIRADEAMSLVHRNQASHRNSMPYKRGDVR